MKRIHCGEDNNREPDGSMLDLHFQSDECENEPFRKQKTMADTTVTVKNESSLQIQEITEPCDNVLAQRYVKDHSEEPESHIKDGKIIVLFLQNNICTEVTTEIKIDLNLMQLIVCVVFNESLHFSYAK